MNTSALWREVADRDHEDGPMRVLLIEDNPADARLVERYLGDMTDPPSRLLWARSLEDGLSTLREDPVDVVLLDLNLPDSDGVETVRRLAEAGESVPLLVLTGREDAGTALWALRAGADEYVYKGDLSSHVLSRAIHFAIERREMQQELRRSEEQLATVFELSPTGIIVSTPDDGTILAANRAALDYQGAEDADQLVGRSAVELGLWVREDVRERIVEQVRTEGRALNVEAEHWTLDGQRKVGLVSARRLALAGEDRIVFVAHDITERKRQEAELARSEERYRTLFEDAQEAIAITRPDGSIVDVNPTWHQLFGYGPDEIDDLDVRDLYVEPEDRGRLHRALETDGRAEQFELQARRADGSTFACLISASVRRTEGGQVEFVSFLRDISERKRFEEELQHRALHDVLTGLPNRGLLSDRLEQAVARARREGTAVALFFVDVDRFKAVNDSFGHETGDQILISVARELEAAVRDEDTVARFGGDEFVVLAERFHDRDDAVTTAERLVETLRSSAPFSQAPYHLTASVGVSVCGRGAGACDADDLLRQADIAMYRAKRTSGTNFHVFDPEADGAGLGRMQREKELRHALEAKEFVPVYQPVVALDSTEPWGVEMLARWDHPERGRLGPGEFIPLAEESGLILTLDRQLLDAGLRDFRAWQTAAGPSPSRLLVNLSASQFEDPAFPDFVASKLEEHGVPPEVVHFEVTETELMQSTERIQPLVALGVRLLIDDFGTGYSSLGYLRELDVNGLKVDMSFVQGITDDADDRAIVETILTLGDRLGLEVIAEGIETAEQRQALWSMGCPLGQGYLFARPTDAGEVTGLLGRVDRAG